MPGVSTPTATLTTRGGTNIPTSPGWDQSYTTNLPGTSRLPEPFLTTQTREIPAATTTLPAQIGASSSLVTDAAISAVRCSPRSPSIE
ncbi:unnamed protein product [Linum trigynum]|uniref:Uncharacterized protein n=1 Tax=Linum trigynum TaxID=586398 RepID=A0AAV2F8P0_9ROSI